jgi:hypothetical protein
MNGVSHSGDKRPIGPDPPAVTDASSSSEQKQLAQAQRAFEAGDYRRVSEITGRLVHSGDTEIAAASQRLRRRTSIDSGQLAILLACLTLFCTIAYIYLFRR